MLQRPFKVRANHGHHLVLLEMTPDVAEALAEALAVEYPALSAALAEGVSGVVTHRDRRQPHTNHLPSDETDARVVVVGHPARHERP